MSAQQDISKLTVPQLKKELQAHDLPTSGVKATLIERLQGALDSARDALKKPEAAVATEVPPASVKADAPAKVSQSALPETAKPAAAPVDSKKPLTEEERIAQRVKRYGDAVLTDEEKQRKRQQRFQTIDPVTDAERIQARAARFHIETPESKLQKELERAKRFNIPTPELAAEKERKRIERFKAPIAAAGATTSTPLSTVELASLIKRRC